MSKQWTKNKISWHMRKGLGLWLPRILGLLSWWGLVVWMLIYVDPLIVRDYLLPQSYILFMVPVMIAVGYSVWLVTHHFVRVVVWSMLLVILLYLCIAGMGNWLNVLLLVGLLATFEYYLSTFHN